MSPNFEIGSIVWVRLGQKWWPGRVSSLDECPVQYTDSLKKTPLAIVKFFNESEFHDVTKPEHIFPYSCSRKNDIIRKGLNAVKYDSALAEKFEADIAMAEKLTGGNMDIVKELKESTKPTKIDYSDLGFGTSKPKKQSKDQCMQRRGFSDIAEAIQYKRGLSPLSVQIIEHKVKIMEQPKVKPEDDMKSSTNWFKCYHCGFTCLRLNVIIWHNKAHLKKVADYDSGIRLPGRRKRRRKTQRNKENKMLKADSEAVDHTQINGHASPKRDPSREASQLLADWDDDDDQEDDQGIKGDNTVEEESTTVNGVDNDENEEDSSDDGGENDSDDYDDEYPHQKGQRQPMPKQVDINSAFDALLAESSPLHRNSQNSTYVNNDSDSECSDWEKYYAKESGEDDEGNDTDNKSTSKENQQNGHHHSQTPKTQSNKRSKRSSPSESSDEILEEKPSQSSVDGASSKTEGRKSSSNIDYTKKVKSRKSRSRSPQSPRKSSKNQSNEDAASPPASPGPSISKSSSPLPERTREEQSEEHSSSSSTSSGPAYMLVAVDAHGNNVPMPVLSEGGNHLVAVEASMEDGTTRTLYIDPAHLGPNVDLNNLMLHIDNSGQETVIIPTSTADGEIISSTLVEQPLQDSSVNSVEAKGDIPDEGKSDFIQGKKLDDLKREARETPDQVKETMKRKPKEKRKKYKKNEGKDKHTKKMERKSNSGVDAQIVKHEDDLDEQELPDLMAIAGSSDKFSSDEIVWVLTHGMWWPAFVLKSNPKENRTSILFINCQQKTPLRVNINRLKTFSYLDYSDIFESQKGKAAGLTEAMELANHYRDLKSEGALKESPREFFSRSLDEQKTITDRLIWERRERVALEKGILPRSLPTGHVDQVLHPIMDREEESAFKTPKIKAPEISDDRMSERELLKLASAAKARRKSNQRFVRFIKSEPCLEHLRKICTGKLLSERHQFFKDNNSHVDFLIVVSSIHNTGMDFFGDDDSNQSVDVLTHLLNKFEKEEFDPAIDSSKRTIYVNTVLFPEAIKESLRAVAKIPEEELETILKNGLFQTRTELKAKRLDYT